MLPSSPEAGLQLVEHRLALGQLVLRVGGVDLHEHVALLHEAAAIDAHLGRDAAGVAGHRGPLVGHETAGQLQNVASRNDFDAARSRCARRRVGLRRRRLSAGANPSVALPPDCFAGAAACGFAVQAVSAGRQSGDTSAKRRRRPAWRRLQSDQPPSADAACGLAAGHGDNVRRSCRRVGSGLGESEVHLRRVRPMRRS